MKKLVLFLVGIVALVSPSKGFNQYDRRNFWVLNNSGYAISEFYVSPHEQDEWGGDTLDTNALESGSGELITWTGVSSCYMDFKIVFDDGSVKYNNSGTNVCHIVGVLFTADRLITIPLPE
jgi:hypothetical protein